ncbi:MAG: hypothetical protein IJ783_01540 [Kiritimatiellae bacterium]|nr:hypothetical protein [Kiritimatiellia bacterium]
MSGAPARAAAEPAAVSPLRGRKVALCVTGSIAAYKACFLVRLFAKAGAEVSVAMTPAACKFVAPLTFFTLSRRPVAVDQFEQPRDWVPGHVALADWCDVFVVAPCTADFAAKMALGLADDVASAAALACRRPFVVAPAMNEGMWENPAVRANVKTLRDRGAAVVGPGGGDLACGASGRGRMAPPEEIFAAVERAVAG